MAEGMSPLLGRGRWVRRRLELMLKRARCRQRRPTSSICTYCGQMDRRLGVKMAHGLTLSLHSWLAVVGRTSLVAQWRLALRHPKRFN